jgi:small subunit ribosomal protein S27e
MRTGHSAAVHLRKSGWARACACARMICCDWSAIVLTSNAFACYAPSLLSCSPPAALEKQKHKLKRLVQSPNSYFMDVKCAGCFQITTVFSHSQSVQLCSRCSTVLATPTGGKCRLTEGASFRWGWLQQQQLLRTVPTSCSCAHISKEK